jgi:AsmA protein
VATASTSKLPAERTRRYGGFALWGILILLLVAALVPPWINVNRYRGRVVEAISRALGRNVTASGISMRLLPRPGLVLSGFVVADDPQYGAEPMLRADEVAAYLRLGSLWRARLEIGTLSLDNPSLNLVEKADGHWNLEELIQRTSQVSSAPTPAKRPEARPRFPYIEASGGRINFKLGQVKKAFSFTDADFALWRQSESDWGVRLLAKPTRTDLALSDTGLLRVDGRFQSAQELHDTPVTLKVDFTRGQLGQITKLIYGRDRGWRGGTNINANLTGTPAALSVVLDATVDDFRRYDIALGEALRLRVHCTGTFSTTGNSLNDAVCESPIKPGVLRISGNAENWGLSSYQVALTTQELPMDRVISFARHVKKDLPQDLNASGEVEAAFEVRKAVDEPAQWSGGGRTSQLALHSGVLGKDLEVGAIEFAVPGSPRSQSSQAVRKAPSARRHQAAAQDGSAVGFALLINPFPLSMGATSPTTVSGYFDEESYRATISGDTEVTRLVQVSHALGIFTPFMGLSGRGEVELELSGSWVGFAAPVTAGQMLLHDVSAEVQGLNEPLHIDSAKALLANGQVNVLSFTGGFASGPEITGSAGFPVHCPNPADCAIGFELHSNELSLERLNQLLNPAARSSAWSRLLSVVQQQQDALLKVRVDGKFDVAHFHLGRLPADNLHGELHMSSGHAEVDVLRSDLLGGHHSGKWLADFTQSPPRFEGGGGLQKVSMDQLSTLMHDNWATGQGTGKYGIAMQGSDAASLLKSITGSLDFAWTAGSLRNISLEGHASPLTFSSFAGILQLGQGKLTFNDCQLKTSGATYDVKGTATYDRAIDFRLQRSGGPSYVVAGSLEQPQVQVVPAPSSAQAQLR